jgi:hypothetical protein
MQREPPPTSTTKVGSAYSNAGWPAGVDPIHPMTGYGLINSTNNLAWPFKEEERGCVLSNPVPIFYDSKIFNKRARVGQT